jgi:2-polyprenyl-3-methyl-5-hydroxy-6-metoxy-1,4-benzoquinol methylase
MATIWDNIYKDYKKGGDAWATLAEDIDPLFIKFIDESAFEVKSAFDIGCGTGKYLKFLQAKGFNVEGIDSSETAVQMSKENLEESAVIELADMYDFDIPKDRYDLVLSISTLHHGKKEQIKGLIDKIYNSLATGGKIFITLPDFESSKKWNTFKDHKEIAPGTYSPLSGPELGLPHSFFTEKEVRILFSKFKDVHLVLDKIGRWFITGSH